MLEDGTILKKQVRLEKGIHVYESFQYVMKVVDVQKRTTATCRSRREATLNIDGRKGVIFYGHELLQQAEK